MVEIGDCVEFSGRYLSNSARPADEQERAARMSGQIVGLRAWPPYEIAVVRADGRDLFVNTVNLKIVTRKG
jgi:hypothetical protein